MLLDAYAVCLVAKMHLTTESEKPHSHRTVHGCGNAYVQTLVVSFTHWILCIAKGWNPSAQYGGAGEM